MALKKYFTIALVVIMAILLSVGSSIPVAADPVSQGPSDSSPGLHTGWMTENYTSVIYNRTFEYYIPSSYNDSTAVPLLFSFHGLGSTGDEQRDLTNFDELAEQEGFIAVFPNATNLTGYECTGNFTLPPLSGAEIQWNLGGESLQYCAGIDDVGFVSDMIDWFKTNYAINASRIYSTGMSDGALFSYLLAFNLTGMFAAIAPVGGPMPWGFGNFTAAPITVIEIHGTDDPILYYNGYGGLGGNVTYSVAQTIDYWKGVDNITSPAVPTTWNSPTVDPYTQVTRYVYSGGTNGTQVILFKATHGGHTWPGGPQYLKAFLVGRVSNQIAGSAQIWKYLPPLKYCLTIRSSSTMGSVTTPGHNAFTIVSDPKTNVKISTTTLFFSAGTGPTVVNLTATPKNSNYEFVNWTGDVSTITAVNASTTAITINPNTDYQITANFEEVTTPTPSPSGGCFIATAAYGTPTAKQLDVLRAFRDDVLLKSTVGSRLVDFYYRTSPPIADFISEHSVVRTLVRELLIDPIVWVVQATENMWQS
jgi:polyhydroxybutyrate depolymerase